MSYTAFEGYRRIASGGLDRVKLEVEKVLARGEQGPVLNFEDATGHQVDLDFREAPPLQIEPAVAERAAGRPRLGVIAKEVTLLPRHWDWLGHQPGGASAALRSLVDEARNLSADKDCVRQAQEAAYRFLSAMAGSQPGFEEAMRALFARHRDRFEAEILEWPIDVRDHGRQLASPALD